MLYKLAESLGNRGTRMNTQKKASWPTARGYFHAY
jgi:hypothetical protein